jgi:hypothetical protein
MKLGKNSFINKISKVFPKKSCDSLIRWFEKNLHLAAPGLAGSFNTKLDNLEICLHLKNDYDHYSLGKTLNKCIKQFKKIYPEVDKYLGPWDIHPFIQLMKYEPGNFYRHIHCENEGHPPHFNRAFAWMIFLNTIKKGGGTKFIYQNIVVKPVAGDFYIWPAGWTHFHQGVNAPNEKKYILTGWINYSGRI